MQIHALNANTMSIKTRYRDAKGYARLSRLTSSLLDSKFCDVPIYTWVIEHPEGMIVIDTGMTAQSRDIAYFPLWQRPYWQTQYAFHITPETEIGAQMRARGLSPRDVRWVIVTHAHFDHTGGMSHFPNAEFIFSRKEWDDVQRFRSAHFDFPAKYPEWLKPRLIDYSPRPLGAFSEHYTLTQAGDVHLVPTPGHTMGHQSVILQDGQDMFFFAADASFDQRSLLDGTLDAPANNAAADFKTRRQILRCASMTPLIYLTTHDFDTERRLQNRETLQVVNGRSKEWQTVPMD